MTNSSILNVTGAAIYEYANYGYVVNQSVYIANSLINTSSGSEPAVYVNYGASDPRKDGAAIPQNPR